MAGVRWWQGSGGGWGPVVAGMGRLAHYIALFGVVCAVLRVLGRMGDAGGIVGSSSMGLFEYTSISGSLICNC